MTLDDLLATLSDPLFVRELSKLGSSSKGRDLAAHEGELVADGSWSPPTSPFIVRGDLIIGGTLFTSAADRDGDLLIVTGEVRCRDLVACAESTTYLAGALTVDQLLFAATRDVIFEIFGPLRAGAVITGAGTGWLTSYHDRVEVGAYCDYFTDGRTRDAHPAMQTQPRVELQRRVVDEVLEFDEWDCMSDEERAAERESGQDRYSYAAFDERAIEQRFRAGKPVLRAGD